MNVKYRRFRFPRLVDHYSMEWQLIAETRSSEIKVGGWPLGNP